MYIDPIFANTIWVSLPFLLSTLFVAHRWRWPWFLVSLVATFGVGLYRQVIIPSDVFFLFSYLGIGSSALTVLSWFLYGELLRLLGGVKWPSTSSVQPLRALFPFLCGALIGELGAAALLAPQVSDSKARARVVLSAMAGGLISPVGDANILVMANAISNMQLYLIPLGLLSLIVISPKSSDLPESNSMHDGIPVALLLIPIALYFFVPQNAPLILLECSFFLALYAGKRLKNFQLGSLMWLALLIAMLAVATAGGLPEFIALGSENIVLNYAKELPLMLGVGGALAGAIVDGSISAVFVQGFVDRALDLSQPQYHFALASGFAIGGIFPLVVGRCLKAGLKQHILLVAIGSLYIWFASTWLF